MSGESYAIDRVAEAIKKLAEAEGAKARALTSIAKTYERQVDLEEYHHRG